MTEPARKIGEILVQSGLVNDGQLNEALELSRNDGLRLGEALVKLGVLDRDRLTWALGSQFDLTYVDLQLDMIDWDFLMELSLDAVEESGLLPLSRVGNLVTAVTGDPTRPDFSASARDLFPYHTVVVQLAAPGAIRDVLLEARRYRLHAGELAAPPSHHLEDDADEWLRRIDDGRTQHLLMIERSGHEAGGLLFAEDNRDDAGREMEPDAFSALADGLSQSFVREFALPGGFCGLRGGAAPARIVELIGTRGRLLSMQRIPLVPINDEPARIYIFAGPNPLTIKSEMLQLGAELLVNGNNKRPAISLEVRIDAMAPGFFQSEISSAETRVATCRHLFSAAHPALLLLEVESIAEATRLSALPDNPLSGLVLVMLRAPIQDVEAPGHPSHMKLVRVESNVRESLEREFTAILSGKNLVT